MEPDGVVQSGRGSLVFLEHVFWVVSLNTLFILIFAFCPYHIGHFTLMGFKLKAGVVGVHFSGLVITMTWYCVIGILVVILQNIAHLLIVGIVVFLHCQQGTIRLVGSEVFIPHREQRWRACRRSSSRTWPRR